MNRLLTRVATSVSKGTVFVLFCAGFLILLPTLSLAQDERPSISVPLLSDAPMIDDFLQMSPLGDVASQMTKVKDFIQREPRDGEPSSQRTEVYLGRHDDNLHVIFVAHDKEPDRVRAHLAPRESVFNDDIVEIMLDTFLDKRRAVAFACNPLGIQWDALWTEGSDFDSSFDTVWQSEGRVTGSGYIVHMTIPYKSLRFTGAPVQNWGVIFIREIRRSSEQAFWPEVSSRIEGRLNQAATLTIDDAISAGRNLQLIPYGTYRAFRLLDEDHPDGPQFGTESADANTGFDAKYVLKDKLVFDGTLNPDFSQVESDQPQVTVNQRFEVFFPEKRPFFLENANFFQTPYNLVFTRRIADPFAGGRVTGKLGAFALGALVTDDEGPGKRLPSDDPDFDKRAFFGIFRLSRDVFEQSNIGVIFTDREFGGGHNRVGGIDGRLKLSPNWATTFQAVMSSTEDRDGGGSISDPAYTIQLDRRGRTFGTHYHYRDIGKDFRSLAGFVPRTDFRDLHLSHGYRFRPEGDVLFSWGPDLFVQRLWDQSGTRLDEVFEPSFGFELARETDIFLGYISRRERLRRSDFDILTENQDYALYSWEADFETDITDEFSIKLDFEKGRTINFDPPDQERPELANQTEIEVAFDLKPSTKLSLDLTHIFLQLDEERGGARVLRNQITRSRLSYQFSRELSVRTIFEYEITSVDDALTSLERESTLNADVLVTYLVNPWTALFVGVNSNYQNLDLIEDPRALRRTRNRLLNDGRQFFIKYSHLIRF